MLLIDKPVGRSSFDVVKVVRRVADMRKIGHTGTLDPLASGLLVVLLGRCTKLARYLDLDRKAYEFEVEFGKETETGDREGDIIRTCEWEHIASDAIRTVLDGFVGDIQQVPPQHSAVKVDGERAYALARRGEDVELEARTVHIESIELLEYEPPLARLRMTSGGGTYVRSVARDLAERLDSCGYCTEIRRTRSGAFEISEAVRLDDLDSESLAEQLQPPSAIVVGLPTYQCSSDEALALGYGQFLTPTDELPVEKGDAVAVVDPGGELVAVTRVRLDDRGEVQLKPERVLKPQN